MIGAGRAQGFVCPSATVGVLRRRIIGEVPKRLF